MTNVLFDFFGTLVSYSASRTGQGHPRSHALVPHLDYPSFVALVDAVFDSFDRCFVGDSYVPDYAGPTAAGIPAYLIDPAGTADVPADRRLASVFDLPARLS
jgi:FMN phosphatase YigB (HAD superfamily)